MRLHTLPVLLGLLPVCSDSLVIPSRLATSSTCPQFEQSQSTLHPTIYMASDDDDDDDDDDDNKVSNNVFTATLSDTSRALSFSALMVACGAVLGPFLDSYHSAFGVLQYDDPIYVQLWGSVTSPALITAWWVPELFGLAGFIIGWLYILLDAFFEETSLTPPTPPKILIGISFFTAQYWLSGVMSAMGIDRTIIFGIMTAICGTGFVALDGTKAGFITSVATALGGPLIEIGLLTALQSGYGGYHYTDSGEFGFFPLWIIPVYFLGGPANGNLARGFWSTLSTAPQDEEATENKPPAGCKVCNDSRCVGCPSCDAEGYYVTYGRSVKCNACKGRGLVICRSCFSYYGEDPVDIDAIRRIMSKIPD